MKGDLLLKALELAARTAGGIVIVTASIATTPYGTSTGQALRELEKSLEGIFSDDIPLPHRRYGDLRYRLRKDGLIEEHRKGNKLFWRITPKGSAKLRQLQNSPERLWISLREASLQPRRKSAVLVIFDIPERQRRKRLQLRAALRIVGGKKLQQSVWRCDRALPEKFLQCLKALELLPYVEILEISKKGTLAE